MSLSPIYHGWGGNGNELEQKYDPTDLPSGDVDNPQWNTATRAWASTEGAAGVIFVQVASGILVIKGSSRIADEVYASLLLRLVNIQSPKMRIVQYTGSEWGAIKVSHPCPMLSHTDRF